MKLRDTESVTYFFLFIIGLGSVVKILTFISEPSKDSFYEFLITLWWVGLILLVWIYGKIRDYVLKMRKNLEPCVHGIKGGKSRLLCKVCQTEKELKDQLIQQSTQNKVERENLIRNNNNVKEELQKIFVEKLKSEITYYRRMDPFEFEAEVARIYAQLGYSTELTSKTNDEGKDIILRKNNEVIYVECKRFSENTKVSRPILQKLYGVMVADGVKKGIIVTTSDFTKEAIDFSKKMGESIELVDSQKLLSLCRANLKIIDSTQQYKQYCTFDLQSVGPDSDTLNWLKSKNINYCHKPCGDLLTVSMEDNIVNCRNNHKCTAIGNSISEDLLQNKNTLKRLFCPKCGAELTKRKQSNSNKKFWGCKNYPTCRYTANFRN
jgi:restriction system protein